MKKLLFLFAAICLAACDESKIPEQRFVYDGPVMEVDDLNVAYSDSGHVRVKMSTARQLKMANENEKYPKAVYVNFIDKNGVEYSSLRGDSAIFDKQENFYKIMGNVFFYNRNAQQSLSTRELIWNPSKKIIYSKKKVQVNTPTDQFIGDGFEATEDFSRYKFVGHISGYFQVDSLITQPDPSQSRVLQE